MEYLEIYNSFPKHRNKMQHLEFLEHHVGYGCDDDDMMMAASHADLGLCVVGFAHLQSLYLFKYMQNIEEKLSMCLSFTRNTTLR